ncbi:hypothetical protein MGN70_001959 [Eutypa lata]|nr:hypothetical protein MGN70_001959 [Eutypa lata]
MFHHESRGGMPAVGFSLLSLAGLASAAAKSTTEVVTSTLLIPYVSTASGDFIHASVVAVADEDDGGLTTLNLQCVNGDSACANGVFEDRAFIYGPATVSVELDHDWSCAISAITADPLASASSETVCSYSEGSPVTDATNITFTDDTWNTAVTITSGVDKLPEKKTRTTTFTSGGVITSTITELDTAMTAAATMTTTAAAADDEDDRAVCKRATRGGENGSGGDDDAADADATDEGSGGSAGNPCSDASRWGLNTSLMGSIATISSLGLIVLLL